MKLFNWIKDLVFTYTVVTRLKPIINRDNKFGYIDTKTYREYTDLDSVYDIIAIKSGYGRDKDRKYYKIWLELVCWDIVKNFEIGSDAIILKNKSRYITEKEYESIANMVEGVMLLIYKDVVRYKKI